MRMWMSTVVATLLVIAAVPACAQATKDIRALTGVVSCEWQVVGRYECRRRAAQDCVRECVSVGSAYVLVTDKKMYWLSGNAPRFDQVAGGAAVVTGVVDGNKLTVLSISDEPKRRSLRSWK
jgi:hypothetical protein